MRLSSRKLAAVLAAALAHSGCAAVDAEPQTLEVTCGSAKCDGWEQIQSLWRDAKKVDLGDLLKIGMGLATDQINDQLGGTDYATFKISEPKVFATEERASLDLSIGNINLLVTGLVARYGEKELTTEVNRLRRDFLMQRPSDVYGESAFKIGPNLKMNWGFSAGGFGNASLTLGFEAGKTIEARIISRYSSEVNAVLRSPLKAMKELRGFIMPRSLDDIRSMNPGESLSLTGEGHLGVNIGAGVPLVLAEPTAGLTYNLVFSAAMRTRISGQLDVQLVRMDGDQAVIDVGVSNSRVSYAGLAVEDGWGVAGLLKSHVTIGGVGLDLGKLADKTLKSVLNKSINLVSARFSREKSSSRMSVARFRVSMSGQGSESDVAKAVDQALRGDIRLAQALANRGEPGIVSEFDMSRGSTQTTSYAGIQLVGMNFFYEQQKADGNIVIQTPGGVRSLMFDSLRESSDFLFFTTEHGYSRTGLGGLILDNGAAPRNEANFFLQIQQGKDSMTRDKLLDHLDGVITSVAGDEALAALEPIANQLENAVDRKCRPAIEDSVSIDCIEGALVNPEYVAMREQAMSNFAAAVSHLDPAQQNMVLEAASLRLAAQAKYEWLSPTARVITDVRFDDGSIRSMMSNDKDGYAFRDSLVRYLKVADIDRGRGTEVIAEQRGKVERDNRDELDDMRSVFRDYALRYRKLLQAEEAVINTIGEIGPRALEIRYTIDSQKRVDYESAAAQSFAFARAKNLTDMYDKLYDKADFSKNAEQMIAYGMMGMSSMPKERLEVRLNVDFWSLTDSFKQAGYGKIDAYSKGSQVTPIDAGIFNLDALISGGK